MWERLEVATAYLTGGSNLWHADKRAVWNGLNPDMRAQVTECRALSRQQHLVVQELAPRMDLAYS
jgi:hypothetical protein